MELFKEKDTRNKILADAIQLFMRYGVKSVTMDDVAKELGISKKTLYQYFQDKDDLVQKAFEQHLENDFKKSQEVIRQNSNPIEQLLGLCKLRCLQMSKVPTATLYDLKKYHPDSWTKYSHFKSSKILPEIRANLELGIEKGYYRADVNVDLICNLYLHLIDFISMNETEKFAGSNMGEIIHQIMDYHLHAITSTKGRKYLETQQQIHNQITYQKNNP